MADGGVVSEIVAKFLLDTCQPDRHRRLNQDTLKAMEFCSIMAAQRPSDDDVERALIPLTTGSCAELNIRPMYSCVGDIDIMGYDNAMLAIPAGYPLPTQLPDEFHSCVGVVEIIDSDFPGYVYLMAVYVLTDSIEEDRYNAIQCQRHYASWPLYPTDASLHGPAISAEYSSSLLYTGRVAGSLHSLDTVFCLRCLSWPTQAADWPTRRRNYGWPDSATVERVVSNGCDVVQVAHRLCRPDKWLNEHQWRLSFSRAEVELLNSWIPVQQILYHMLRVFMKTERLAYIPGNTGLELISNYTVKSLTLRACELKARSWWIWHRNVVGICVELLHTLAVWVTYSSCPHYFINNCNLFDHRSNNSHCAHLTVDWLLSITESYLAEWFVNNYIRRCSGLCNDSVSRMFDDVRTITELRNAVTVVVHWKLTLSIAHSVADFTTAQHSIVMSVHNGLNLRSCLCWMRELADIDHGLYLFFTAVTFLHVNYKIVRDSLNEELLDILATTCLQSNYVRRCLNARGSSVVSLSQATKLMKVVANKSRSTVQLIEIELSKAYLYRASRCKDSDNDSIYCLANVYLAVLYYTTGQYQTALDHCTLVTRSRDHLQCSSHTVQGEILPKVDDDIDNVLGLAVFYQHIRTAVVNEQRLRKHVSVFSTTLFANFLHLKCLSLTECHLFRETSLTEVSLRYRKFISEGKQTLTTDLLLFSINSRSSSVNCMRLMTSNRPAWSISSSHLDSSVVVDLLQQSAVEQLSSFRQFEAREFGYNFYTATTDFESLYAYKRGAYRRCLEMCTLNVRMMIGCNATSCVLAYPEFIQLMDDGIVSLAGLTLLVQPSCRDDENADNVTISQLSLSLYLMTQCQMKLHHSVTSLAQILGYIKVGFRRQQCRDCTFDQLLLKLTQRKILKYVSTNTGDVVC